MCTPPAPAAREFPRAQARRSRGLATAFTIVELLVVISILSILIALLFPSLQRARRTALVLASPVIYVGVDNRLHLTDPSGAVDLPLAVPTKMECPVCHSPPAWTRRTARPLTPAPAPRTVPARSPKPWMTTLSRPAIPGKRSYVLRLDGHEDARIDLAADRDASIKVTLKKKLPAKKTAELR